MKYFSFIFLFLASHVLAQFPALSPYQPFIYHGFESRLEANGQAVSYGALYKTAIALDGSHQKHGDSAVVAYVLGAHGPTNCNTVGDTLCQRHRAYVIQRFRGHNVDTATDSTRYTGVRLRGPIWTQFWYKYSNLTLRNAPYLDWESPATWCDDSTDACIGPRGGPVTLARDSAGYILFEHVPIFSLSDRIYQRTLANDTDGGVRHQATPNRWHLIQTYMDLDSANGYGLVWVDGVLHSKANIQGMPGTLAQFHAGLYASPAVASGTVWNDDLLITHVPDTNYAKHRYMRLAE